MKKKEMFYLALGVSAIASAAAYIIIKKKKSKQNEENLHDGSSNFAGKKTSKHLTPVFSKAKAYHKS